MTINEELVDKFIKQAKIQVKVTPPVSSRKKRLFLGMIISMIVAAIYSSVAELINIVQVPGIPLYFQPFGTIGNVLYTMLLAGLASLAVTWGEKATSGMLLAGFIILYWHRNPESPFISLILLIILINISRVLRAWFHSA